SRGTSKEKALGVKSTIGFGLDVGDNILKNHCQISPISDIVGVM
ncbi:7195_t:CDS:2, partial [Rhizophagus irregularis]